MSKRWVVSLLAACLLAGSPVKGKEESIKKWSNRVIPLPKQLQVQGSRWVSPRDVSLVLPRPMNPVLRTAKALLNPLSAGAKGFEIQLVLTADTSQCPRYIRSSLATLPNRDQAYAIRPIRRDGKFQGLLLAANTPLGLLYAARTLAELVRPPSSQQKAEEFPEVSILDWPDLAERGEWSSYRNKPDFRWMADRKFNVVDLQFPLGFSSTGAPTVTVNRKMVAEATSLGIKIVPIIWHMNELARTGIFHYHPEVACTPEPGKPLPTDYEPVVCFSQPKTVEILADWIREFLSIPGINEVNIWLSEENSPCYCPLYRGANPYVQQVKGIEEAFDRARQGHPGAVLQILTTQGSYSSNDKVLAASSPGTEIVYYDGGRTYDSSHRPMIYPLLENFARSGRWLGVYPQLTNSWRTVFPFTGPQFIHARMKEFTDKGLSGMIGYATPTNVYYDFNVTAAAEWSWNSNGRSPRDFAEAYAHQAGIHDPQRFAEWAELVGNVGWDLAGGRAVEKLIYPERVLFDGKPGSSTPKVEDLRPMQFGQGFWSEIPNRKHFEADMASAQQALKLAEAVGNERMIDESRSDLGLLKLLDGLMGLSATSALPKDQRVETAKAALAEIDDAARMIAVSVYQWGMSVNPVSRDALPSRFRDTVDFAQAVASTAWGVGRELGIKDPYPAYRWHRVRDWTAEDIPPGAPATLLANIRHLLDGPGDYNVRFQFLNGEVGLDTHSVALFLTAHSASPPLDKDHWDFHIGSGDFWVDYWISVPKGKSHDPLSLRIKVSVPSPSSSRMKRTSHGVILISKSWRGESDLR